MGEESWERDHEMEAPRRHPAGRIMEEESWSRNHRGGIMEKESGRRNHGGGIMGEILIEGVIRED